MTTTLSLIETSELGADFAFNDTTKKWGLSKEAIANDENLPKYRMVSDPSTHDIKLYRYTGEFDLDTASLQGVANITQLQADIDDVGIDGGILNFTDVDTGESLTFDTNSILTQIVTAHTNTVRLSGNGKDVALEADVIVDSDQNILKVSTRGLTIDKNSLLALINANEANNTLAFTHDNSTKKITVAVGNKTTTLDTIELTNTQGQVLGYMINPTQSTPVNTGTTTSSTTTQANNDTTTNTTTTNTTTTNTTNQLVTYTPHPNDSSQDSTQATINYSAMFSDTGTLQPVFDPTETIDTNDTVNLICELVSTTDNVIYDRDTFDISLRVDDNKHSLAFNQDTQTINVTVAKYQAINLVLNVDDNFYSTSPVNFTIKISSNDTNVTCNTTFRINQVMGE